jgi:hypothetical protein
VSRTQWIRDAARSRAMIFYASGYAIASPMASVRRRKDAQILRMIHIGHESAKNPVRARLLATPYSLFRSGVQLDHKAKLSIHEVIIYHDF